MVVIWEKNDGPRVRKMFRGVVPNRQLHSGPGNSTHLWFRLG